MNRAAQSSQNQEDGIIWLSSYPKSGNTWLRLLLGNYFYTADNKPLTINDIQDHIRGDISMRIYREPCEAMGWDLSQAVNDIGKREYFIQNYIKKNKGSMFLKTHSCFHATEKVPYFSPSFTKGFICVVRDPRDVLCSFARHEGKDIDEMFEIMVSETNYLFTKDDKHEFTSSWDKHVNSFIGIETPTIIIRYEDMLKNTKQILGNIVMTLKDQVDEKKLEFAVKNSDFSVLQGQEKSEGFRESSGAGNQFFGSGRSGGWEENLSAVQIKAVEDQFGETMKKFGYL